MKKLYMMFALALSLFSQSALAAHIGWYQLDATWRDGQFSGQFYYDAASPFGITKVTGTLVDLAQTTNIDKVWNLENPDPQPWVFLANTTADQGGQNAGFYLTLVDLGATLALDTTVSNNLYDWSNDAYFNLAQLDESPLQSYAINAIPLPGTVLLMGVGLLAMRAPRRRKQQ
ncbi:PEP-CTERM sorting domain-containing protein [Pseudoduganella aquatica]|uniref:PEP-CTERM sorting domain-containing protein n=1 Tax=Pseudoduganella aquatica TaxID=2660641 RepID=A0A7X4KKV6_9BURK|nr:PEP-CTERM sorting domain-containing protein [Pseudoduganella aquatica]MYN06115.1 hypothetical protein [Pseudoduganella aquatica]